MFQLDPPQIKRLLGHQKCTFRSQKWYLYIHVMRNFDQKLFYLPTFMFLWSQFLTYLTNSLSFLSDFCWNKNKNKPKQPLLYSLFQDSEGTSTSTETNNTSYESPDTQLFGALRKRAWHHLGGATPTSRKSDCYFSF